MRQILKVFLGLILVFSAFYFLKRTLSVSVIRSMYYWSTENESLSKSEKETIQKLGITRLYVKFFEVELGYQSQIIPVEKSSLKIDDKKLEVVPTVFVRNNVFKSSDKDQLTKMADDVVYLIERIYERNITSTKDFKEIQIDCDWTIETKRSYFFFLKEIKRILKDRKLSATLRLYAYKFPDQMGVLPTDRATLMCYNLLSPIDSENRNSILDLEELKKYLDGSNEYPVPLDVALPIYSDVQIYHNSTYTGLVYDEDHAGMSAFPKVNKFWRKVENDTLFHDYFLRRGDLLKHETVSVHLLSNASQIIQSHIPNHSIETLILFHLDDVELKSYTHEELDALYGHFDR